MSKVRLSRCTARRAGFTLAEVLVTILIMSFILVSITQILQAARMSRDTINHLRERQLAGPAIMDLVERDLRGLLTYCRTKQLHLRVRNRVMLGQEGDSIDFITTSDNMVIRLEGDRYVESDYNEVGYRLMPSRMNDGFLEIYRREDLGIDDEPFDGGEYSFLHDRVKDFEIKVYEEDGPEAEPLDEWGLEGEEQIGVPARLEIYLTLENADRVLRERWLPQSAEMMTVTYRRVLRLEEGLRQEEPELVVPMIPSKPEDQDSEDTPVGGPGGGDTPIDSTDTLTAGGGGGGDGIPFPSAGDTGRPPGAEPK